MNEYSYWDLALVIAWELAELALKITGALVIFGVIAFSLLVPLLLAIWYTTQIWLPISIIWLIIWVLVSRAKKVQVFRKKYLWY